MNLASALAEQTGLANEVRKVSRDMHLDRRKIMLGGSALSAFWAAVSQEARADPPFSSHRWFVNRLTMGLTDAELALAQSFASTTDYLEYHLNYTAIDDSALNTRLQSYTTLTMQPYELIPIPGGQARNELTEAAILRSVFSRRQLFERMVEFWTDHFNIDISNGLDQQLKTIDDRDVIRTHALGSFPALLSASAHSPAMLYYLDNTTSTAGNPNENYARELMELHTMGVTGGYTQTDVTQVARCFTGWTMWNQNANPQNVRWTFRFNSAAHDNGAKVVLDQNIPANGGMNDGNLVLNILATHPSTARFISTKLCKWFHSENPPTSLIDAVTATYTATSGDIKSMLRTLFANTVPESTPLKYKRPYHQFVSGMRATGATITNTNSLRTLLTGAGQLPFTWSPPDGFPDSLEKWVGLILPRWNFGASMLNGNVSGVSVNIDTFLGSAVTADAIIAVIDQQLFGGGMPTAQRDRIRDYLLPNNPTTTRKRDAVGLAISSPAYQWY